MARLNECIELHMTARQADESYIFYVIYIIPKCDGCIEFRNRPPNSISWVHDI